MNNETKIEKPDWSGVERVLVIMAHPDDPDFSCAGTAIQMARQGIEVTYMILTNGDKGNHNPLITRNQLILMREAEQRTAAELCGVKDVLFMGEEDGFLRPTPEIRKRVCREIRRIRPQLIICPSPERYFSGNGYINHPDHRNAGLVALEAIFPAADNPMFYPDMANEGYRPHKISQLYVSGHHEPTVEVDITDDLDLKIRAILSHKSQFENPEEVEKWMRERWGEKQPDGTVRHFERF
ncbi:MAG: PIG-L family deacetylase, partial [Caldilineae bacterium]